MLNSAVEKLVTARLRPASVAVGIKGARPRLGAPRIDEMRDVIAGALGIGPAYVSVTASTGNLSGAEGKGLGISATAMATVVRA